METTEKTQLSEKLINAIKKAIQELEEFRLQAALGKAEARDLYEEARKKFLHYVTLARTHMSEAKETAKERKEKLKTLFEELKVQLSLGKAETKEIFEEQRKNITRILNEIEELIKSSKTASEYYSKLQMEVDKFRIKLKIIKMRYELNRMEARLHSQEKGTGFTDRISEIKKKLELNEEEIEEKWEAFKEEISDAYSKFKKAFA